MSGRRFGEFDAASEIWTEYVERLEQHFIANDITATEKKRATLISSVGRPTYHLMRSLTAPIKPKEKSFEERASGTGHEAPQSAAVSDRPET